MPQSVPSEESGSLYLLPKGFALRNERPDEKGRCSIIEQLNVVQKAYDRFRLRIAKDRGAEALLKEQKEIAEIELAALNAQLDIDEKAVILLQKTSDFARRQVKGRFEEIVTNALRAVYGDDRELIITLDTRANQPIAEFRIRSHGIETSIEDSRGGGVMDIVSITNKIAAMLMYKPQVSPILILDEPAKMLDKERVPDFARLLKAISEEFGIQIIMVSHHDHVLDVADRGFRVEQGGNGVSKVRRVG